MIHASDVLIMLLFFFLLGGVLTWAAYISGFQCGRESAEKNGSRPGVKVKGEPHESWCSDCLENCAAGCRCWCHGPAPEEE